MNENKIIDEESLDVEELTEALTDEVGNTDTCECGKCDGNYIKENIIDLDKTNIKGVGFDNVKFRKGIDKMSKLCGMITALTNVGITPDFALSYIAENTQIDKTTETSVEITKLQAQAAVSASKYNLENAQKNMI